MEIILDAMRLWRARRRHDYIDAMLREDRGKCVLEYVRNDRHLITRVYQNGDDARADAAARLKELQRAGWVDHW